MGIDPSEFLFDDEEEDDALVGGEGRGEALSIRPLSDEEVAGYQRLHAAAQKEVEALETPEGRAHAVREEIIRLKSTFEPVVGASNQVLGWRDTATGRTLSEADITAIAKKSVATEVRAIATRLSSYRAALQSGGGRAATEPIKNPLRGGELTSYQQFLADINFQKSADAQRKAAATAGARSQAASLSAMVAQGKLDLDTAKSLWDSLWQPTRSLIQSIDSAATRLSNEASVIEQLRAAEERSVRETSAQLGVAGTKAATDVLTSLSPPGTGKDLTAFMKNLAAREAPGLDVGEIPYREVTEEDVNRIASMPFRLAQQGAGVGGREDLSIRPPEGQGIGRFIAGRPGRPSDEELAAMSEQELVAAAVGSALQLFGGGQ